MQQHMDIFIVLGVLILALCVFFVIKMTSKSSSDLEVEENNDKEPEIGNLNTLYGDDVIAVRKVENNDLEMDEDESTSNESGAVYVFHVMAKPGETFKGYELLQALLSQGLRFGEMSIFHRYQQTNGKGPVLFSLTSAVEPGTFDIHDMGSCSCPGLTLFMTSSGRSNIDIERFNLLVKTIHNLARELNGVCQDKNRQQLTDSLLEIYKHQIFDGGVEQNSQTGVA